MNFLCPTLGSHIKTLCWKSIASYRFLIISFVNLQDNYLQEVDVYWPQGTGINLRSTRKETKPHLNWDCKDKVIKQIYSARLYTWSTHVQFRANLEDFYNFFFLFFFFLVPTRVLLEWILIPLLIKNNCLYFLLIKMKCYLSKLMYRC